MTSLVIVDSVGNACEGLRRSRVAEIAKDTQPSCTFRSVRMHACDHHASSRDRTFRLHEMYLGVSSPSDKRRRGFPSKQDGCEEPSHAGGGAQPLRCA